MATYTLTAISAATLTKARAQATAHVRTLNDELRACLTRLAADGPFGTSGGYARAKALSARRGSELARHAAMTQHHGKRRRAGA